MTVLGRVGRQMQPKIKIKMLGVVTAAVFLAGTAGAQTSPEEQAGRLFEDGRAYWNAGKHKQALDNFNTIVSGFPNTGSVDDALLEVGRYYLEVDHDIARAREAFEKVAQGFPQSDGAPGAYYHLGLLTMRNAAGQAELDDALAQFTRVRRLYPLSPWVPRALQASGLALRKGARLQEAVAAHRRAALEYPLSEAAPAAQFEIGHCLGLLGRPREAMEEFQRVRNSFGESPWAARALERITGLYRLYGFGKPRFRRDSAYSLAAGNVLKDVRALLMTRAGTLWVASDKVGSAIPFNTQGTMGPGMPGRDLRTLSLTPRGEVLLAARLGVRHGRDARNVAIPSDKPGQPETLDKITAAVLTTGGSLLVADEKRKRVFRFDSKGVFKGVFGPDADWKVIKLSLDEEGAIIALDVHQRSVSAFDESGRRLRGFGLKGTGYDLRKPSDVAVDPLRNVYVADAQAGVYIFTPEGQLLATLGRAELKRPTALTLGPSGDVLVYDAKQRMILRYH